MALKGIVIDPGHGGSDAGAVANNVKEKDYNLKISKYMYDRFKSLGIPVSLTRSDDTTLSPKNRANKIKELYGTSSDVIVLSNHLNAGGGNGAEVIYALRNNSTLSRKIIEELEKKGQTIRKYYQLRLPNNSSKDYYFIHRDTPNTEALIVEYGFIDNKDDLDRLEKNYKNYAEAVIKAVLDYKGLPYTEPDNSEYYTVVKGDSLWNIAKKYNTTVSKLKSVNNLSSNTLSIGLKLKIPEEEIVNNSENIYTVKKGDTLSEIAASYGIKTSKLKSENNLTSDIIKIGQKLKIPTPTTYTVKKGDSLWLIAKNNNTTVSKLKELNSLTSNTLQIGQKIKIPN